MTPEEVVAEVAKQPHLIKLIAAEVGDQVDRKSLEREERFLKVLAAILAIIGFIGYAGFNSMVDSAVNSSLQNKMEVAIDKRVADFEVVGVIASVQGLLNVAEQKGSFSNTARDEMIRSIEVLAEARRRGVKVSENPAFKTTLENVVDTMASSNNDILADRIFDLFPDECLKVSGIVQTYLQHYGRQGAVGLGAVRAEAIKRFGQFERAASTFKVPDTALAHRALIEFQASGQVAGKGGQEAIVQIGALDRGDREQVWVFWSQYAQESWVKRSTGESVSLKKLVVAFLKSYQKELRPIFSDVDEVIADVDAGKGSGDKSADEKKKLMDLLKGLDGVKS